jgi:hypothetical protein
MNDTNCERHFGHKPKVALLLKPDSGTGDTKDISSWIAQDEDHRVFLLRFTAEDLLSETRIGATTSLQYLTSVFGDTLTIDNRSFRVPAGRSKTLKAAIAESRHVDSISKTRQLPKSYLIQKPTVLELLFLSSWLDSDEEVQLWIRSKSTVAVASPVSPVCRGRYRLLLTNKRTAWIAFSSFGDVKILDLTNAPLCAEDGVWTFGQRTIAFGKTATLRLQETQSLVELKGRQREIEIIGIHYRHAWRKKQYFPYVRDLIQAGIAAQNPWSVLSGFFMQSSLKIEPMIDIADVDHALTQLMETHEHGTVLADWWAGFELDIEAGLLLLDRFSNAKMEKRWSLPFHRRLRDARHRQDSQGTFSLTIEIAFASHLLHAEEKGEAIGLLQKLLEDLPPPYLGDLLPAPESLLTHLDKINCQRLVCLELLARATSESKGESGEMLHQLVQIQPTNLVYLEKASRSCDYVVSARAVQVRELLEPNALVKNPSQKGAVISAISSMERLDAIDLDTMRHPAARDNSPLTLLQTAVAQTSRPEGKALRDFCSNITSETHPDLVQIVQNIERVLGLPPVSTYISRGERDIGLRSYPGDTPLLLIGGRHLESSDPFHLNDGELLFSVASELAHLALGHERATPEQVWAGLWGKGQASLDLVFTVLPAFKGWAVMEKVAKWWGLTKTAAKQLDQAKKKVDKPKGLGLRSDDLIAAHQLMQLSADRIALLFAGDPKSAIRSMYLMFRDQLAYLQQLEKDIPLHQWVLTGPHLEPVPTQQCIRICALLSYYLSDEYQSTWERLHHKSES